MSGQRAILKGPGADPQVLSLLELYISCHNYWVNITVKQKILLSARRVVLSDKTIWPNQCDRMLDSLQDTTVSIRMLLQFLSKHEDALRRFCSSRSLAVATLNQSTLLLDELIGSITSFRENCWEVSHEKIVLLIAIKRKYEVLFQHWKTMQKRVTAFLDQVSTLADEETPVSTCEGKILQFRSAAKAEATCSGGVRSPFS